MEEHIKKYAQIAQTGHYEPPKIEEEKDLKKIEQFDIIEPKKETVQLQMDNNLISVILGLLLLGGMISYWQSIYRMNIIKHKRLQRIYKKKTKTLSHRPKEISMSLLITRKYHI